MNFNLMELGLNIEFSSELIFILGKKFNADKEDI